MQFDEQRWVDWVRNSLMGRKAEALGVAAKVSDVPRALHGTKPEAYAPHHFALGLYHQSRPELRAMERYKLAAAKRVEKRFNGDRKIEHLVQCFLDGFVNDRRAAYHRFR